MTDTRSSAKAELTAIHEVARNLTSTRNLDRALGATLHTLQSFLGFDRTAIFRPDEATREIRVVVAIGYTAEQREHARYVLGKGTVGKTMKTGRSIVLSDVRSEPSFPDAARSPGTSRTGPISHLSVPIRIGPEPLGAISAERIGRVGARALEADERILSMAECLIWQALKPHNALRRLQDESRRGRQGFEKPIRKSDRIEIIEGRNEPMQEVLAAVTSAAASRASVLLRGENGTGKKMIARAIHQGDPAPTGRSSP